MRVFLFVSICLFSTGLMAKQLSKNSITNNICKITLQPSSGILWSYQLKNRPLPCLMQAPVFEIDNRQIQAMVEYFRVVQHETLSTGVRVYTATGRLKADSSLTLEIEFRVPANNPVIRFRYRLLSSVMHHFTKKNTKDNIEYFTAALASYPVIKEIRLSDFNSKYHANTLTENLLQDSYFADSLSIMGPVIIASNRDISLLFAYEHGSQYPDRFLEYNLLPGQSVSLKAVKGNYLTGQPLSPENHYETIWFEIAQVAGNEDQLAAVYRTFILKYMSENKESRQPYIFYNTWGRQERVKWAGGTYLSSMDLKTTLAEIEIAHRIGIDVYVLDVGWFQKTGDWNINTDFFPDTLKQVKALLDKYKMKLGLWFNPLLASKTSKMLNDNKQYAVMWNGKTDEPFPIWETEASVRMSLVSPYWKNYADQMIDLAQKYGVTYFKLDGIAQYAANGPGHFYGTAENSQQERQESYAFQLPIYLNKIIDRVVKACPLSIFDFDITEDGRSMGLQFLSSGKYFIINNGPYFHNFDLAEEWKSPLQNGNANIFVNPGPSRGWYARSILSYDKWIPSVLFLTHYQPDEPRNSQLINLASLVLGQNGIWGDLNKISEPGIQFMHDILVKYKEVKNDITESNPVVAGETGSSPEIHEKINSLTGKGVVAVFANLPGTYTYITRNKVSKINWHNDDVDIRYDKKGRAVITMKFAQSSAKIIFFGVK